MKKLKILRMIFASLFMVAIVGVFSCTKPKPDCKVNNTGTITIYNDFPGVITVDVYDYYVNDFLGECTLGLGMSTTYTVHSGDIQIWEIDEYSDWGYWDSYVNECEAAEFSVYQGKGPHHINDNPLDIGQKIMNKHK